MAMPSLTIKLEGDNAWPDLIGKPPRAHVQHFEVTALSGGMASGNPSVAFRIDLPDGTWVFAETSLRLFLSAADAFKAKYGDPR